MTDEELKEIHRKALLEFDDIQAAQRQERMQCLEDRRFYSIAGAQWEGELSKQYSNKPRFEVNKIHLSIMKIISEYRNNRITVDFVDKFGKDDDKLASALDGLFRADEIDSGAHEAYDNAFEEAVGGGIGAFRLRADYEDEYDEENEQQRIFIEPLYDADGTVFFDLGAKRQDKKDAKTCYILTSMTHDDYKETWGDDVSSWDKTIQKTHFDWSTKDNVYICEHYRLVKKDETIFVYKTLDGKEVSHRENDIDDDLQAVLNATGAKKIRERIIKVRKVRKYIMSGSKVLKDCGEIAGSNIPVVQVFGKRWYVDNVERCMGHVRLAKDAQRLKNMLLSKLAEIASYGSVEKPILLPEQISGHKTMWEEDNITPYPYLLVNPITDKDGNSLPAGPIAYTKPPSIPPALAAALNITEEDIKEILGNQQEGEKITSNISGKVVELVQNKLDMQTYIYMDNLAKAERRAGEIWLCMAKDVYVENDREMKMVGKQGEVSQIILGKEVVNETTQKTEPEYDIANAKYDIAAMVGPSSSSKRASTVRSLTEMMQVTNDPQTMRILSFMTMMNMEGEGVDDARQYFRKQLVREGAIEPTEKEKKEMAEEQENAKPDPNEEFLLAEAKNAKAKAEKTIADIGLTEAKIDKIEVENIETLAGIDRDDKTASTNKVQGAS